ncbi:MAG: universal stress protein [Spirochaetaceae bacterium]
MSEPIKNIMVYLDGTEQSITAVQYAIILSKETGAELTGIYVVNTRALNDLVKSHIFIKSEQDEYHSDLDSDADKYLDYFKELATNKNLSVKTIKESGSVLTVVKDIIKKEKIDLLIIGELSRIRSRRDEFFSDTEKLMRQATCSVLIVKDEDLVDDIYEATK